MSWDHPGLGRVLNSITNVIIKERQGEIRSTEIHCRGDVNTKVDIGLMHPQIRNARMTNVPQMLRQKCNEYSLSTFRRNKS